MIHSVRQDVKRNTQINELDRRLGCIFRDNYRDKMSISLIPCLYKSLKDFQCVNLHRFGLKLRFVGLRVPTCEIVHNGIYGLPVLRIKGVLLKVLLKTFILNFLRFK